jgi:hypothetical protein
MFRRRVGGNVVLAVSIISLGLTNQRSVAKEQEHERDGCPQSQFGQFSDWSEPVNLGPAINTPSDDYHPAISNDGLTLYFTSNRPGGFSENEDIWVSQRASLHDPWGEPRNLGPNINSVGGSCCPNLTPDEHWLFFAGNRPASIGGVYNLWVSHRDNGQEDFGREPPINLGPRIHSGTVGDGECAPTFFNDQRTGMTTLYFCRQYGGLGDFDIYVSMLRRDGVFGRPALAWELDSPQRDTRTAIRRDGLEMFITSGRPGGFGALDVWVSTRETTQDAWSTPVNVGPRINTAAAEGGPALSCDGTTMYFYSTRPGGFGGRDLYATTRTELCDENEIERTDKEGQNRCR